MGAFNFCTLKSKDITSELITLCEGMQNVKTIYLLRPTFSIFCCPGMVLVYCFLTYSLSFMRQWMSFVRKF